MNKSCTGSIIANIAKRKVAKMISSNDLLQRNAKLILDRNTIVSNVEANTAANFQQWIWKPNTLKK